MRRGVTAGPVAGSAEAALDHCRDRAFSIRAGDVDRRPGAFRPAERVENSTDIVEPEFDAEVLERKDALTRRHRVAGAAGAAGAAGGAGTAIMNRSARAIVVLSSRRSTIRSSMPRSIRNSLR